MSIKNQIGFKALLGTVKEAVKSIPDKREQDKVTYSMWDIVGSTFAMMFFQDPSLLQFQERMKERFNKSNLQTIFGVKEIPKDKRIRTTVDETSPEIFRSTFKQIFKNLKESGELSKFEFLGKYVCPIDASQYFSSKSISCKCCLKKNHKDCTVTYSHQVLVPLIVHPDKKQVLPLMPEGIKNGDGALKQDCELNAAKRLIPRLKEDYPELLLIITGDALYAHQGFIELVRNQGYSFILTAKEGINKTIFKQIQENATEVQRKEIVVKDKKYECEWINNLDLNLKSETIKVNYFFFRIIDLKTGEVTYKNSWVTDLKIDENNIEALVRAGRSRWKIENECFNILKNHGYEMEHNYGHGEENLSINFFILTLLSLLFHQIHLLVDEVYQKLRTGTGSMKRFWSELKTLIKYIFFDSWDHLLKYALSPPDLRAPA